MRGRLILALVAASLVAAVAATAASPFPDRIDLPDGWQPEGVAAGRGHELFVGSIPTGAVYRADARTAEGEIVVPGREGRAAIGLKADHRERLFVAGGETGMAFVYDGATGDDLAQFQLAPEGQPTFVNDVALTRKAAYFTDSQRPVLYVVDTDLSGAEELALQGFAIEPGFNLNGIATEPGGRSLLTVHSATGQLFRIPLGSRVPAEVAVQGGSLTTGDGLVTLGRKLLVVRHVETPTERIEAVVTVDIRGNSGRVVNSYTDDTFGWPTTAAVARDRLLVVNSQFDRRSAGLPPELPFTVSGVSLPRVLF